ncbi:MAG TPA: hypothetical protein DD412_06025 [Holosporales bacterium]|nr:hypothetical protein [Holosporales bacterium]
MSDSSSQPYSTDYFVKYNPALKEEFGSQTAVLLFDRLEYWFKIKKNEFYKFIEPCDHPLCREGDTWTEELRFSKKVFRTAFDKIGIRYKSKTEFEKESNPFKGKLFAYYQDRQTKKTIFVRNNSLVTLLYARLNSIRAKTTNTIRNTAKSSFKKGSPTVSPLGSPYAGATKDKQINTSFIKKEDCFPKEVGAGQISDQQSKIALEMKAIWEEEIGSRGLVTLTPDFSQRMLRAYEGLFQGSLDRWRAYCLKIASSKFLMGEKAGTNYQLRLPVVLTETFKIQLEEGRYELSTRETSVDRQRKLESERLRLIAVKTERGKERIEDLKREKVDHEKRLIMKRERALSLDEMKTYKQTFEGLMTESDCSKGAWFREKGWDDFSVKLDFQVFLWDKLKATLAMKDLERPDLDERILELERITA